MNIIMKMMTNRMVRLKITISPYNDSNHDDADDNANKNNEVRADEEWMGRYLKYSGKVTNITRSSVYLENNYYEVVCKIGWFKGEPLKSLNKGDRITISGRNMESTDFIVNYKTVYLQNCEIL